MTTITFDAHSFVKKLKAVGFAEEQAEVFASEQARLIEDKLATKNDLNELENNLRRRDCVSWNTESLSSWVV
ncbi:MAG TPA: hypothetical protein VIF37_01710 [Methylobacter sp.]